MYSKTYAAVEAACYEIKEIGSEEDNERVALHKNISRECRDTRKGASPGLAIGHAR